MGLGAPPLMPEPPPQLFPPALLPVLHVVLLQANDLFAIMNAVPAIALILYGFLTPTMSGSLCFGAGLGITLFGIAYMFVHDGLVHRWAAAAAAAEHTTQLALCQQLAHKLGRHMQRLWTGQPQEGHRRDSSSRSTHTAGCTPVAAGSQRCLGLIDQPTGTGTASHAQAAQQQQHVCQAAADTAAAVLCVLCRRRFPVGPIAELPYMKRVTVAHKLHHSEKYGGVPWGLFLGPQELESIGAGPELDRLVEELEGKSLAPSRR